MLAPHPVNLNLVRQFNSGLLRSVSVCDLFCKLKVKSRKWGFLCEGSWIFWEDFVLIFPVCSKYVAFFRCRPIVQRECTYPTHVLSLVLARGANVMMKMFLRPRVF